MAEPFSLEFETQKFQRWTQELIDGVEDDVASQALRKIAFDFSRKVIMRTPVDTGRARAGWSAWIDDQPEYTVQLGGRDPQAVKEGKAASDYDEDLNGSRQSITIVNAVEYILALEFGHSAQAPAGFMRITMRELQYGPEMTLAMQRQLNKTIRQADRTAFKGGGLPG